MADEKKEETASESGVEDTERIWYKALDVDELPEGRVKPVTCAHKTVCMTRFDGTYAALDNKCPHQGGPLGEGSIEQGWLRCPWHGWDFHPLTGVPPGGYDDGVETYPVGYYTPEVFKDAPPKRMRMLQFLKEACYDSE